MFGTTMPSMTTSSRPAARSGPAPHAITAKELRSSGITACTALALTLAVLGGAGIASAQTQRAIVLDFSGPGSSALQREVREAFDGSGWEAVADDDVASMARRLGAAPDSREVAAELGVSAIVQGTASRRGRRRTLEVEVRDASSGATLGTESFNGRNARALRLAVRGGFWGALGSAVARGHVPEAQAPAAVASTGAAATPPESALAREDGPARRSSEPSSSAGDDASPAAAPTPLFLALGMIIGARELSYNDDVFLALRPYSLPAAWGLRGQVRWYPGAHFTSDFLGNIGIAASAGGAIGLSSRQRDGTTYGTEAWDFHAGVDVRIPLAPVEFSLGLGYGAHTFALGSADSGQMAELPNVGYQYVRPSARIRADFGAGIYAEADFGWRILTASGAFGETWFPRSSGTGFDLAARLGWQSDIGLGVRAGFEMQRYFFTLNPEVGDPYIAGGAADQFLTGTLDVTYQL